MPYFQLGDATGYTFCNTIIGGVRPTIELDKMDEDMKTLLQK